jgi:ATP-dependent Clp protease protease subunit
MVFEDSGMHSRQGAQPQGAWVPNVFETGANGERGYDIFSYVMKDRIVWLGEPVTDTLATVICSQLLFLAKSDPKKDITMYIMSPGGSVTAGMGIYDTMNHVSPDVRTVCLGQACSMGAFLLSAGAKGKRSILPNGRVMIHQPSGGAQGTVSDMLTQFELIQKMKVDLNLILAWNCQKEGEEFRAALKRIQRDVERDHWMNAYEAVDYGIADQVLPSPVDLEDLRKQAE